MGCFDFVRLDVETDLVKLADNYGHDGKSFSIKVYGYPKCYEPRREKTGFLHMRKQRRRSAKR